MSTAEVKGFVKTDASGFKSQLYERTNKDGKTEYFVAFAGTEDGNDWGDNVQQAFAASNQYDLAIKNADAINNHFTNGQEITYGGHSLGGGLATAAALRHDKAAVTFNPAWLSLATLTKYGLTTNWLNTKKIDNYVVGGEILGVAMCALSPVVVQTGKTHILWTWDFLLGPNPIKLHFIDSAIEALDRYDQYNKVRNTQTGKDELDKS